MRNSLHLFFLIVVLAAVALLIPDDTLRVSRQGGGVDKIEKGNNNALVDFVRRRSKYMVQKRYYEDLIDEYRNEAEKVPEDKAAKEKLGQSYYDYGMFELKRGRTKVAKEYFKMAVKYKPSLIETNR